MSIAVERASASDAVALASLFDEYRQFYGKPSDVESAHAFLTARLEQNESVVFFAGSLHRPAGFMQLYPSFSSLSLRRMFILNDLYVRPSERRRGIARALLAAAEAYGRSQGAKGLVLQTARGNATAQALYSTAGWREDVDFATFELNL